MKVTGPMLSFGASGTIGGTATFATWKGRPYVRQTVIPSNPRSPGQTSQRAMMQFIAQQWKNLSGPDQASWMNLAQQGNFSTFNAYTKYNLQRWSNNLAPTEAFPANESLTEGTLTDFTATGATKSMLLTVDWNTVDDNWGLMFTMVEGPAASHAKTDVIAVILGAGPADQLYTVTGLKAAQEYSFSVRPFSIDGKGAGFALDATGTTL